MDAVAEATAVLKLTPDGRGPLRLLCLGAHSDDLEIGCGGTVLELLSRARPIEVTWVVLSAQGPREAEARTSAGKFLRKAQTSRIMLEKFQDGYLPTQHREVKDYFETLKRSVAPDLILAHSGRDLHQDHRLVAELCWNTFRDHWILEYEIPKYDGDLGAPNVFVPLSNANARSKLRLLMRGFATQRSKRWFTEDTFLGLMRLRGLECNSPSGYAEAYYARKTVI